MNDYNDQALHGEDFPLSTYRRRFQAREKLLYTISGLEYDINNVIGAGIFVTPSSVWRLVQSPGATLMLWLAGGFISLFGSMIYVE
ncbi:7540_t:CDS:2, partial [Dentiscutata heterogama]